MDVKRFFLNVKVDIDFGSVRRVGKTTFFLVDSCVHSPPHSITQMPVARLYRQEAPPTLDDLSGGIGAVRRRRIHSGDSATAPLSVWLSRPSHTYTVLQSPGSAWSVRISSGGCIQKSASKTL